jgi:hypothetical protein
MKSAKNLLIPFIIMILLGIGVVVFFAIDLSKKVIVDTSSSNSVDFLYVSPVDIASVNVLHKEGNLNVRIDKKTSSSGSDVYSYSGSDKGTMNYSQTSMGSFVEILTSYVGCTLVSENANLSEFGLDAPAFTITINKTDGSSVVVLIGNLAPDPSSCYVCAQGSATVYLASADKYRYAAKTAKDFLDSSIIDVSLSGIESVRFVRKKDSVDISANCVYDESTETYSFRFFKPFETGSSAYFDRLIERICSLEAKEYEEPTPDNITKFGLANPQFTFTLKTKNGQTYTLDFSSAMSGYFYGRLNGAGKIFKISSDMLESVESPLLVLISSYVFYDTCDNVDSVECTSSDKRFVLKLDVAKGKAISDEGSTVTLDGRNAKVSSTLGRSYAAMLYESVFCINVGGVEENAFISSSAVPVTSIKIFDRNHSSVVYDFYRRNDESCYVCKDGQYTKFYVYNSELYNDGGTDTYNYGIWPAYEILTTAITNNLNGIYDIPSENGTAAN